ncbi:MAG: hypothetical protein EPN97_10160 [Alphaproteobacteria bacterium]|nr:MAG: hypothetical protein EPN97_10160 [Alphaproteobacteria bacterium]
MEDFNTSLVREKIVFIDDAAPPDIDDMEEGPNVVRSNRVFLKLGDKGTAEKVVVRAQNMHTTLRMASKVLADYFKNGPLSDRAKSFDWDEYWAAMLSNYEREFNPYNWAAVYINGKPVFRTKTSPFVDVVEQCALLTVDNYDATMKVAQGALKKVGKAMRIKHSTSVAAVLTDNGEVMRCGFLYRADGNDLAFNFGASGGEMPGRIVQSVGIAAALLEALNLRYITKKLQEKLGETSGMKSTAEANQLRGATGRLVALDKGISSFEELYDVRYRPEKPVFFGKET